MRILAIFIVILAIITDCYAIRCYAGSASSITTIDSSNPYCMTAYIPCGSSYVSCTAAEMSAGISKWAYYSFSSNTAVYPNQTFCATDFCNKPTVLPDGFWCYTGYGHSKENYGYKFVIAGSGYSCSTYGRICNSGYPGCTQELIDANHVMSYASVMDSDACSYYSSGNVYLNFSCCKGEFCARPTPLTCNYGVSSATGTPLTALELPFDDTTYSCISYNEPCNGTYCPVGIMRSYRGYAKASTCLNQPAPAERISCCNSKQCNTGLKCYVGMSPKTALLTTQLLDGYPTECAKMSRNCSVVTEGCSALEVALGTSKFYYTYKQSAKCGAECCYEDGCNAPASLSCYNTTNAFNQSQPDSTKSIEKYDSSDNCARFSYDCSNSIAKKYCTPSEISKGTIKTIYGSATDAECDSAQKDYMNTLDPYCCKSALCNSYAAVKASLSCYSGDFISGQGIPKTSYTKLPSAGSYKCYSKSYTCTSVSSSCTQDNVDKKATRIEYGVTTSCSLVSCCSSNLCNRLDVNPLIEPTTSTTNKPSSSGSDPSPKTSYKANDSPFSGPSFVLGLLVFVLFINKV